MRKAFKNGAMIMAPMIALVACSEDVPVSTAESQPAKPEVQIDPLLQGPMGLIWLESKDSIINRGLVSTMKEYSDYTNDDIPWDDVPFSKDDPSCFFEDECYTVREEVLGSLFNHADFEFEDNRLVRINFDYKVYWDIENQSLDVDSMDQLFESLHAQLDSKYESYLDLGRSVIFRGGPIKVELNKYVLEDEAGNIELTRGSVVLDYQFDTEVYASILNQRAVDQEVSQAGL